MLFTPHLAASAEAGGGVIWRWDTPPPCQPPPTFGRFPRPDSNSRKEGLQTCWRIDSDSWLRVDEDDTRKAWHRVRGDLGMEPKQLRPSQYAKRSNARRCVLVLDRVTPDIDQESCRQAGRGSLCRPLFELVYLAAFKRFRSDSKQTRDHIGAKLYAGVSNRRRFGNDTLCVFRPRIASTSLITHPPELSHTRASRPVPRLP